MAIYIVLTHRLEQIMNVNLKMDYLWNVKDLVSQWNLILLVLVTEQQETFDKLFPSLFNIFQFAPPNWNILSLQRTSISAFAAWIMHFSSHKTQNLNISFWRHVSVHLFAFNFHSLLVQNLLFLPILSMIPCHDPEKFLIQLKLDIYVHICHPNNEVVGYFLSMRLLWTVNLAIVWWHSQQYLYFKNLLVPELLSRS